MDVPPSPYRVFDFPMTEPEPHHAYNFFAAELTPRLAKTPGTMNGWIEHDVPLLGEMGEPMKIARGAKEAGLDLLFGDDIDDDDDEDEKEDDDEWLVAPVTPLRATVTLPSTYKVMVSQAVHVVSKLEEIETRVQQVESGVDTQPSGYVTGKGQDVIVRLSQQVQTL
nr:hypothetical protein [Tanacetum cinerariifolium]